MDVLIFNASSCGSSSSSSSNSSNSSNSSKLSDQTGRNSDREKDADDHKERQCEEWKLYTQYATQALQRPVGTPTSRRTYDHIVTSRSRSRQQLLDEETEKWIGTDDSNPVNQSYRDLVSRLPSLASGELVVLVSDLEGLGLFTTRSFTAGEIITMYGGSSIYNNRAKEASLRFGRQYKLRVPGSDYHLDGWTWAQSFHTPVLMQRNEQLALPPKDRKCWDPSTSSTHYFSIRSRACGFMCNHSTKPNARLDIVPVDEAMLISDVCIVASKPIQPYSEVQL
jgi:hypothetical protein